MSGYSLSLLDPQTDHDLYVEAYSWRGQKRHAQPDRMPLEVFASDDPSHLTIGLFNGELCAVYFLHETEPSIYQAHFTSRRGLSKEILLAGAAEVAKVIFTYGGTEIHGWVTERNEPLRSFLEDLGFKCVTALQQSCGQDDTDGTTLPPDERNPRSRVFVKYVLKG